MNLALSVVGGLTSRPAYQKSADRKPLRQPWGRRSPGAGPLPSPGGSRTLDRLPLALRLDALYFQPGIRGAHEKGGVEGWIGWFRRNHLVPVPEVDTLAEFDAMIDRWDQEDDARRIRSRPRTIGEYFAAEQPLLAPLPV